MPFIGSEYGNFLDCVQSFRVCWSRGRLRGGKTSVCFRVAYDLLSSGKAKYLVSNIPNVWNTRARDLVLSDDYTLDAVVVLDEGGLILQSVKDAFAYLAALGKLNVYLLIPSMIRPNSKVCFLDVQRLINWVKILGVPAWTYQYTLRDYGQSDKGAFTWLNPWEIYGVYSSKSYPLSDGGFRDVLGQSVKKLSELDREYWDDLGGMVEPERDTREGSDIIQQLTDAVQSLDTSGGELAEAAEEAARFSLLLSSSGRHRSRRR